MDYISSLDCDCRSTRAYSCLLFCTVVFNLHGPRIAKFSVVGVAGSTSFSVVQTQCSHKVPASLMVWDVSVYLNLSGTEMTRIVKEVLVPQL